MSSSDAADRLRVVLGLGNPGPEYERTRHNVGVRLLAAVHREAGGDPLRRAGGVRAALGRIGGREVWLLRSRSFMNVTGEPVAAWMGAMGIPPSQLLVLTDDMDLPLGRIRIRSGGGTGGHKGLLSLVDALGTRDFPRLRVGIGSPPPGVDPADYVLDAWSPEEEKVWESVEPRAAEAVRIALVEGVGSAMNACNGAPGPQGPMGRGDVSEQGGGA
jgi:PTH1 family peptidyl-tRNA hydrolase